MVSVESFQGTCSELRGLTYPIHPKFIHKQFSITTTTSLPNHRVGDSKSPSQQPKSPLDSLWTYPTKKTQGGDVTPVQISYHEFPSALLTIKLYIYLYMMEIPEVEVGLSVASSLESRRLDPFLSRRKKTTASSDIDENPLSFWLILSKKNSTKHKKNTSPWLPTLWLHLIGHVVSFFLPFFHRLRWCLTASNDRMAVRPK